METLQMWFYIVSIIFMTSLTIVAIITGIVLWKIKETVQNAPQIIESKISSVFDNNKMQIVSMVGLPVATYLLGKLKGIFFRK